MAVGANNPRLFAETIALDAWRTPFDGEQGEADLHIDVIFAERGRVGGGEAPVRFRLSLSRAEVHVVRDGGKVVDIRRVSVLRPKFPISKEHTITEKKTVLGGGIGAEISGAFAKLFARAKADTSLVVSSKLERSEEVPAMSITHWKTDRGYAFVIQARQAGGRLKGQPWRPDVPVMKIRDTNPKRRRGEPPEVRIELQCLREDLVIEDIQFTSSQFPSWPGVARKKQIVVEQYIKAELARHGLPYADLGEPFARIVLGDATPVVEP